jgi:hypothetical protein
MKGEDYLGILFLAFVCIILASLIKALLPDHSILLVPSFAFICIGLWMTYDYTLATRYKKRLACMLEHQMNNELYDETDQITNEDIIDDMPNNQQDYNQDYNQDNRQDYNQDDIIEKYNKEMSIKENHANMGCTADTHIFNRMKYAGIQPQLSKIIRSAWNVRKFQPYIDAELKENENRDWWDTEQNCLDSIM